VGHRFPSLEYVRAAAPDSTGFWRRLNPSAHRARTGARGRRNSRQQRTASSFTSPEADLKKETIMHIRTLNALAAALAVVGLAACSGMGAKPAATFSQASLPDAVKVPAGHMVAMETVGTGDITYECRVKANAAGQYEWFFVGPDAKLWDRAGKQVGKYYGPPATWESADGSKVTATQVAVAPNGTGNIPHQLVKANPATGAGAMQNVSYIQRVATQGGVAPGAACGASNMGQKQVVKYQADYIFYRAG
jgi:Protein of unknown function (DUF3455)